MSDQSQDTSSAMAEEDDTQQRLAAALRELAMTQSMLRLTEIRLNIAMGMPQQQLQKIYRVAPRGGEETTCES